MDSKQKLLASNIDIIEESISEIHPDLLKILLKDKTTHKNIMWCTTDYAINGVGFQETDEIDIAHITGEYRIVIQPRAAKTKEVQTMRIRSRAEVFTPSWVCNEQNNLVDEAWFGRQNVFNTPNGRGWKSNSQKIVFPDKKKNWKAYVDAKRLEITCGEAPYLVSRYDTTTGNLIPVYERVGLLDRKMRVVNENCETDEEWLYWAKRAMQSVYGYEFQGDSVLIARENLLFDFIDYYFSRFQKEPKIECLKAIANIITWNIWQMDGMRGVVPYSCQDIVVNEGQASFFDDEPQKAQCPGCSKNDLYAHSGIYCRIFDWTNLKKSITFVSLIKGDK